MKKVAFILFSIAIISCNSVKKPEIRLTYPITKKVDTVDVYFGVKVPDPYRWLENDTTKEVAKWVEEQNKLTFSFLDKIPFRNKIKERLTKIWDFPKISAPFTKSGHVFYFMNDGLQNQSVLYVKESIESKDSKILLDPNKLSDDGTVSLENFNISKDGKYLAYSISRSGSDWNEIFIKEISTSNDLKDHLMWIKFSGLAWYNDGFFYSKYDAPKGSELSVKNEFHKVYYHKLGDTQDKDVLVYENPKFPLRNYSVSTSEDEKYLFLYETESTHGNSLFYRELKGIKGEFNKLAEGFDNEYTVIENVDDKLFLQTNKNADNNCLKLIDLKNPKEENWKTIIPEKENVISSTSIIGGKIIVEYMKDAYSQVEVYSLDGKFESKIELPGIGTLGSFNGKKDENTAFYSFVSFTNPGMIYKYDVAENKSTLYMKTEVGFDVENYETNQVFYFSKDGTKIPMFIVHKKGLSLDSERPTLLYGYGGFNISLTPTFSISRMIWLENDGVVAIPNIRGGGEYGEKWHKAGTKLQKQNVFDDFIAAAEYLIKNKYTCSGRLTIMGGSNGGLLVGAVVNQRPDLFAVAIPQVGVMDMLRYHKFTIGWAWKGDYGSSENEEDFKNLMKYSPIHNIKSGTEYPAILVTTADHDDRVVPAHSFKYIATLQEKKKGENPALIRINAKAGHGGGKPTTMIIDELADLWSFAFYNMGFEPQFK